MVAAGLSYNPTASVFHHSPVSASRTWNEDLLLSNICFSDSPVEKLSCAKTFNWTLGKLWQSFLRNTDGLWKQPQKPLKVLQLIQFSVNLRVHFVSQQHGGINSLHVRLLIPAKLHKLDHIYRFAACVSAGARHQLSAVLKLNHLLLFVLISLCFLLASATKGIRLIFKTEKNVTRM